MTMTAAVPAPASSQRYPVLSPSQLLPGDIIITASPSFSSRAIQWATDETVSHALLYWRAGHAVEATPERGVSRGLVQRQLRDTKHAAVLRHKYATPAQRSAAADWALAQVGRPYDMLGAVRIGLQPGARTAGMRLSPHGLYVKVIHDTAARLSKAGHDSSFFCSELIAKAYVEAGVPLTDLPAYLTGPGNFLTASALRYVGDVESVA